jgi:hypothetical protein
MREAMHWLQHELSRIRQRCMSPVIQEDARDFGAQRMSSGEGGQVTGVHINCGWKSKKVCECGFDLPVALVFTRGRPRRTWVKRSLRRGGDKRLSNLRIPRKSQIIRSCKIEELATAYLNLGPGNEMERGHCAEDLASKNDPSQASIKENCSRRFLPNSRAFNILQLSSEEDTYH